MIVTLLFTIHNIENVYVVLRTQVYPITRFNKGMSYKIVTWEITPSNKRIEVLSRCHVFLTSRPTIKK